MREFFKKVSKDELTFRSNCQIFMRKLAPEYDSDALWISRAEELSVFVAGPVEALCIEAQTKVRRMDPLDSLTWMGAIAVHISPKQISAPDIFRVVVTRDGKPVEPIKSTLQPQEMSTRMGAKRTIHAGSVLFPVEAFDPGGTVAITAIPESGRNIVKTLTDAELRRIQ